MILPSSISADQLSLLIELIERGPVPDHLVTDTQTLDGLLRENLAVRICANGLDTFVAATHAGRNVYCGYFDAASLDEAKVNRLSLLATTHY